MSYPSMYSCPFCEVGFEGGERHIHVEQDTSNKVACFCPHCGANGPLEDTEREAFHSWNDVRTNDKHKDGCRSCVFCGDLDSIVQADVDKKEESVSCNSCGARGPLVRRHTGRVIGYAATQAWNDRMGQRNKPLPFFEGAVGEVPQELREAISGLEELF